MRGEQPGGECADRIFCGSAKRRKPVESASARGIREKRCKLEREYESDQVRFRLCDNARDKKPAAHAK